jgi:hypothetical protein
MPFIDLVEGAGLNELRGCDVKGCDDRCGHTDSWPMIHILNILTTKGFGKIGGGKRPGKGIQRNWG